MCIRRSPLNRHLLLWTLAALAWIGQAQAQTSASIESVSPIEESSRLLQSRSFAEKSKAVTAIAQSDHPRKLAVLNALMEAELYLHRASRSLVIAERTQGGYAITDALNGVDMGLAKRRDVRKISVNNELRRLLRAQIASLQLDDSDVMVRIAAVNAIAEAADPEMRQLLEQRQSTEADPDAMAAIVTAIMVLDLDSASPSARLAAVTDSSSNLSSRVRQKLTAIAADDSNSSELIAAAEKSLAIIEAKVARYETVQTLFFGLSLGSILVLAAIGLSITFGVMGVINMAHGELMMIGAYTTYVVQLLIPDALEYSLLVAVPAAFIVAGLVGIAIERSIIQFLYGRPLETLLATFGVSLVLQQAVRTVFSPLNRSVSTPEWMSGSWSIVEGLAITYNRLYILIFTGFVFAGLWLVLNRTRLGLEVRAVTQNRSMARAMGIRSARVDMMTFGLGAGIAGIAGVALSQLTNVGPNLGQSYIVDSFMVVVFGGVGNLWGTLVAGLSLGVVNKFLEPVAGAVLAKILVLVFIILFIQKRPRGLFPQKGRAVEA